ncbi:MAG: ribonuclease R, partial [Gammaproteobacteria bacterium]|nr:ribonuclease R [Gammaproteobacteria bacterium]
ERDGQLLCDHTGKYGLLPDVELIRGKVFPRKDGSGFVKTETGAEIYLDAREMRELFPEDVVLVRVIGTSQRRHMLEGKVSKIVERRIRQLVGRFYAEGGVAYVVPENSSIHHDIVIPPGAESTAKNNDFVLVEITAYPTKRTQAIGKVIEQLGSAYSCQTAIGMAIRAHELPSEWDEAVLKETEQLPDAVRPSDLTGREDLRHLPFVTIDGEDARDFDDAVHCKAEKKGWRLWVAIADVSYYVRPDTALDMSAQDRGNSVYFPCFVIPMLPEKLSNGLCSLNPHLDRLCLVAEMTVSKKGKLTSYRFYPAVMHSQARLTYTIVGDMIANPSSPWREQYASLVPHIDELNRLYRVLHEAREERGALDFDTVETRIEFNESREIERIVPVQRNDAHRLIEECMLLANVATAEFLLEHKAHAVFRVHESPKVEKLEDLRAFLKLRGLSLKGKDAPTPKDINALLTQVKNRPDGKIIETVVLRSMNQAVYSPKNVGHFGLAYPAYTHFTSPIRRYPDLLVHRVIRMILDEGDKAAARYLQEYLMELSDRLSMTERRADEASRDVEAALKCSYMNQHVGEEFDGVITGVTNFGLFVMLEGIYIDGLVHVSSLKREYYHFDEAQHALIGDRSRTMYQLGDKVRVKVVQVKMQDRKIDLELIKSEHAQTAPSFGAKASKGKRS